MQIYTKKRNNFRIFFLFPLSLLFFSLTALAEIPENLSKKADQGDANAQYELARIFEIGKRVKSDRKKAIEWYQKAADSGHVDASYRLGFIFYRGLHSKKDYTKAFKYLKVAAEGNNKRAQTYLARMYQKGQGTKADKLLADYWYDQAFSVKSRTLEEFVASRDGGVATETKIAEKKQPKPKPKPIVVHDDTEETNKLIAKDLSDFLLSKNWSESGHASVYIKSQITRCKDKGEKIICTSKKKKDKTAAGVYEYKMRSIIEDAGDNNEFDINYRRLITKLPPETVSAYEDDGDANANKMSLGWEKNSHRVGCTIKSSTAILCKPVGADAFYIRAR